LQVTNINNFGEQDYQGMLEVTPDSFKFYVDGQTSPVVWMYSSFTYFGCKGNMLCFRNGESSPYASEGLYSLKTTELHKIFLAMKPK